jgi:hypothetical protein
MRMTKPADVRLLDSSLTSSTLAFAGERGERFQVSVLDDDLIRVQMFPDGRPRFPRTWTVVGQDGDVPFEGRLRDDLVAVSTAGLSVYSAQDGSIQLQTQQLRLEIIAWTILRSNGLMPAAMRSPPIWRVRAYATTAPAPVCGIIWNIARASTITALASAAESWTRPAGGCACSIWMPSIMTLKRPIRCTSIFRFTSPSSPARKSAYGLVL